MKLKTIIAGLFVASTLISAPAHAESTDDIINALMAKGVLTEEEGALLQKGRKLEQQNKSKEIKGKFKDGISFSDEAGDNKFSVNGRIQLDYRNFDTPSDTNAAVANYADTFDIRRAYLGAKGTFNKYYDWEIATDFAAQSNSSHLDVAYVNIKWWKEAQFQFGQFKMPYSLEERTSSRFIDFQERSFVNNTSLTPGKERGIMLHGTPLTGVNYAVALSAGQGKNTNDVDNRADSNDIIVHADTNIAEILGQKEAVYHVGASYGTGTIAPSAAGAQRTEGRGTELFTASAFTDVNNELERNRYNLESAVAYNNFKLQGEYGTAEFKGTTSAGDYKRELSAYYVEALWLVTGEKYADSYKGGKFDRIKPKNDFNPDFKGGLGAWEVGARYSQFDAGDFATSNATGTGVLTATSKTNKADAWTVGLKWIPTANTRLMLNYVDTKFDTPIAAAGKTVEEEKAILFRTQLDF